MKRATITTLTGTNTFEVGDIVEFREARAAGYTIIALVAGTIGVIIGALVTYAVM